MPNCTYCKGPLKVNETTYECLKCNKKFARKTTTSTTTPTKTTTPTSSSTTSNRNFSSSTSSTSSPTKSQYPQKSASKCPTCNSILLSFLYFSICDSVFAIKNETITE